jgi:hypothetical protein
MITLPGSLNALTEKEFIEAFKSEIQSLDKSLLPLQDGLTQSSHVADSPVNVVVLNRSENDDSILIKTGIFYSGVIAGSCCSDDPTPVCEQNEYCELEFKINKLNGQTEVKLLG